MASTPGTGLLIIERILRDRDGIWSQVAEERGLKDLTVHMLASSAVSLALYGAVLGSSHSFAQAISSAVKLPLLFLATLAICLPTLYLFNLVFGSRLSVMQAVTLIMISITVTAVLTLAFAPISLFFLITADNYSFFKLLNVAILVLAAAVGLRFLTAGMSYLNRHQIQLAEAAAGAEAAAAVPDAVESAEQPVPVLVGAAADPNGASAIEPGELPKAPAAVLPATMAARSGTAATPAATSATPDAALPAQRPASMALLYIWIALFGFVGTQLAWTLRPFFGSPKTPFAFFREIDGTFYGDVFSTIGRLLSG
jgi:hypothetical protein